MTQSGLLQDIHQSGKGNIETPVYRGDADLAVLLARCHVTEGVQGVALDGQSSRVSMVVYIENDLFEDFIGEVGEDCHLACLGRDR